MTIKPGQLRRFSSELTQLWHGCVVTEEGRLGLYVGPFKLFNNDSIFLVVSTDDDGPYELEIQSYTGFGMTVAAQQTKRWHIVLYDCQLVWLEHEWVEASELVCEGRL